MFPSDQRPTTSSVVLNCVLLSWYKKESSGSLDEMMKLCYQATVSCITPCARAQRPSAEVRHEPTADDIDPVTVQEERRRRIAKAQDEELRWSNLKAVLRGETTAMTYKEAQEAWKWADNFVLSSDNVLYYTGKNGRWNSPKMSLRLVVPTTMIQELLHDCHNSIEGGTEVSSVLTRK
ncbi:LOW QUALITY PROTEIN: hypothetical protein PHMEG_00018803 [Phytophthora megakarya]|uniref:Reverse transcriptase n=1 Tax=Phytophthora megakarya TaxID=4795 RepID=A0A225VTZ8_9STRA|nr:LOW QUALITY PROTEIN: hypothetical protein PHMEG_00018803 [Phytophthora megakarya]